MSLKPTFATPGAVPPKEEEEEDDDSASPAANEGAAARRKDAMQLSGYMLPLAALAGSPAALGAGGGLDQGGQGAAMQCRPSTRGCIRRCWGWREDKLSLLLLEA